MGLANAASAREEVVPSDVPPPPQPESANVDIEPTAVAAVRKSSARRDTAALVKGVPMVDIRTVGMVDFPPARGAFRYRPGRGWAETPCATIGFGV
jgi:hypothetical protein